MTFYGFPQLFPIEKLAEFRFGRGDAFKDDLLSEAFCHTACSKQATYNTHTLIVGPPGSGKSALFKAFKESILLPYDTNQNRNLIVGISEELNYINVRDLIDKKFEIYGLSQEMRYMLLWDAYILFRAILKLKKELPGTFKKEIKRLSNFFSHIDLDENANFLVFIHKLKDASFKISLKMGAFLASASTGKAKAHKQDPELNIDITFIKKQVNNILAEHNVIMWVMIDRLDEFVMRENFEIQKKLLKGLIQCEELYVEYNNLFLKIFIRNDLFNRID